MTWHNLRILLLTTPPDPNLDVVAAASLDGIVLHCTTQHAPVASVASTRPEVPIVVLADADRDATLRLIAAGADEVLPAAAPAADIVRALQHAAARRHRDHGTQFPSAPAADTTGARLPPQLEAISRLAGGVAQDFNNLLMVVEGHAEKLRAQLPREDELRASVDAIAAASRRAVTLTQKLLAFGRRQSLTPAAVDLNATINECLPLLRRRFGRGVRVVANLEEHLPPVRADRTQIVQMLMNLGRTAGEAMPAGGTFTVTTDAAVVDLEMRRSRPWLSSGRFVRLQLSDTGAGIEEESLPHVFEPFFTPAGSRGDGLDLPSVYGVVKQSGGFIWIDSRIGQGTRITILLPPAAVDQERTEPPPAAAAPHVLLVEDDEEVRELLLEVLHAHGLRATAVGSAEEALAIESLDGFDLLLTDVGLPGLEGPDLARAVRRRAPDMPVLFISGHSGDIFAHEADLASPRAFLQKPFSSRALVASLKELLGSRD